VQRAHEAKRAMLARGACYFALWVVLIGFDPLDLLVGLFAAALAGFVSVRLLAPGTQPLRLVALPRFAVRFMVQSVVAGFDVARFAFAPHMRLRTGFVLFPTGYPRGPGRNVFASLSSLMPGTVAVRDGSRGLLYHCLDTERGVVAELGADEDAVARALPRQDAA
jgi:multicomponent Na+:H+ antiporter subunit E